MTFSAVSSALLMACSRLASASALAFAGALAASGLPGAPRFGRELSGGGLFPPGTALSGGASPATGRESGGAFSAGRGGSPGAEVAAMREAPASNASCAGFGTSGRSVFALPDLALAFAGVAASDFAVALVLDFV